MNHWWYFLLGALAFPFIKLLLVSINRAVIEYRQKRLIKLVKVRFPDHQDIVIMSINSSDKRAMKKLERQLREDYDIPTTYQKSGENDGTDPRGSMFRRTRDK